MTTPGGPDGTTASPDQQDTTTRHGPSGPGSAEPDALEAQFDQ
ncbi:hypothetical protein [Micromonospora sp. CP22]|nr:hypothetical protein [Micromonospora sp. CP22]